MLTQEQKFQILEEELGKEIASKMRLHWAANIFRNELFTMLDKAYAAGMAAGEAKERERCVKIADKRAEALTSLAELQKNNASIPTVLTNREDAQFFTEGGISASRRIAQHIRELKERK